MGQIALYDHIGPAFYDLADDVGQHGHTHYTLKGGRGSLKSSCVSLLVPPLMIAHPDVNALVLRKVGNTLRDSVFAQYIWAIGELGMERWWTVRYAPPELIYRPTGQRILFRGADDPFKIKSIKTQVGYIGITHFEELDQFAGREEIRAILQSTMRGGPVFWNFESFNPPVSRDNWANVDSQEERADRFRHSSTYLEAPPDWLGEQFLAEAEYLRESDERAWRHEYLGVPTGTGSDVFENIELREITDAEIAAFDRVLRGVDWGYFPDPWAYNEVYYAAAQRTLYVFGELTANRLDNEATAGLLRQRGLSREQLITADSAEPKSVADYNKYGLRCVGAAKGPGSVERSMVWLQSLRAIVIDPRRCPETKREFIGYEYLRTRSGEIMSGYPDADNHHIDAVRYATEQIWKVPGNAVRREYQSILGR